MIKFLLNSKYDSYKVIILKANCVYMVWFYKKVSLTIGFKTITASKLKFFFDNFKKKKTKFSFIKYITDNIFLSRKKSYC